MTNNVSPSAPNLAPKQGTYVEFQPAAHFEYNGKQYQIKHIKQRQGFGTESLESEIDLKKITPAQEEAFIKQAIAVMEAIENGGLSDYKIQATGSFTLHFSQRAPVYHFITRMVAGAIPKLAPNEEPITLEYISYKQTQDTEEKIVRIAEAFRKKPEVLKDIHQKLRPLHYQVMLAANKDPDDEVKPEKAEELAQQEVKEQELNNNKKAQKNINKNNDPDAINEIPKKLPINQNKVPISIPDIPDDASQKKLNSERIQKRLSKLPFVDNFFLT